MASGDIFENLHVEGMALTLLEKDWELEIGNNLKDSDSSENCTYLPQNCVI